MPKTPVLGDPVDILASTNNNRDKRVLSKKYKKMAEDAFAFLRATADLYYARIDEKAHANSPFGWMSGDLHIENFGVFQASDGSLQFDINDFDQCAHFPASVEVVRFASSIMVAADVGGMASDARRDVARKALAAYFEALASGESGEWRPQGEDSLIESFVIERRDYKRAKWLNKWTKLKNGQRKLESDKDSPLVATSDPSLDAFKSVISDLATSGFANKQPKWFGFLGATFHATGLGSLGLKHYAALVQGDGLPDGCDILDFKQALPSIAVPQQAHIPFSADADRILTVQRLCQARPPALAAATIDGNSYVARISNVPDEKIEIRESINDVAKFREALRQMADVTAWSHLRSAGLMSASRSGAFVKWGTQAEIEPLLDLAEEAARQNKKDFKIFTDALANQDPRLQAPLPKP